MNALLEDAIRKNDYNDVLFAIENGANIEILEAPDFASDNANLIGNCDYTIE